MAALLSLSLELFVGSCSPLSFGGCACWLFVFNFWFQLRIGVTITGGGTHFLNHALTYPLYVHIPIEADPGSSIRRSSVHLSSGLEMGYGDGMYPCSWFLRICICICLCFSLSCRVFSRKNCNPK